MGGFDNRPTKAVSASKAESTSMDVSTSSQSGSTPKDETPHKTTSSSKAYSPEKMEVTVKSQATKSVELIKENVSKIKTDSVPKTATEQMLKVNSAAPIVAPVKYDEEALEKYKRKLSQKEEEYKKMESELKKLKNKMSDKDKKIDALDKEIKEIKSEIERETKDASEVMAQKDQQISALADEINELEEKINKMKRELKELSDEKMDWNVDVDQQSIEKLERALENSKTEFENVNNEKDTLMENMRKLEETLEIKTEKLKDAYKQMKDISENCKYLQSQLLAQKTQMEENVDKISVKLIHQTKVSNELRAELSKKEKEMENKEKENDTLKEVIEDKEKQINVLKQETSKIEALKINKEKPAAEGDSSFDNLSTDEKLRKIFNLCKVVQIPKVIGDTSTSKNKFNYINSDVQVHRVRSKEAKFLMAGHPELFRNMEGIPSLRKGITELSKSNNLNIVTEKYEGFQLKNLLDDIDEVVKKPSFAEATGGFTEKETNLVVLYPGNHYASQSFLENNKGKQVFVLATKIKQSIEALACGTIEILSSVIGKNKEVVVVIDPSSDITFEYSRKFAHLLSENLTDWKNSMDEEQMPKITVWDLTEEQMQSGERCQDKRNCLQIIEGGKEVWLDCSFLTADNKRVSKIATIKCFNRIIDKVSESLPPAEACEKCGIQQSSSYGSKCLDGDTGEYLLCTVCGKDSHDITNCWSLKFQSEQPCKHRTCIKKELKHAVQVHDIINPTYQEEARKALKIKVEFWSKPNNKKPFFSLSLARKGQAGPPSKQKRGQ